MNYDDRKPDAVVNVLGTDYRVYLNVPEEEDKRIADCDGYCDKTTKLMAVVKMGDGSTLGDINEYVKYVVRHEVVHAFLFESGIGGDTVWDIAGQEHPEHMVEWIAMQFPKMLKVYEELGVL